MELDQRSCSTTSLILGVLVLIFQFQSSSSASGARSLSDLEFEDNYVRTYVSVGAGFAGIIGYGIAMVIIPTSLVLLTIMTRMAKFDPEAESPVAEARSLLDNYIGIFQKGENCFLRVSCEVNMMTQERSTRGFIVSWLLSTRWGKQAQRWIRRTTDSGSNSCEAYPCLNWKSFSRSRSKVIHPRLRRQAEPEPEDEPPPAATELSIVFLQDVLRYFRFWIPATGEETDITSITTTFGSWAKFSGAVFLLGIPITVFVVALFLVALVTLPPNAEEADDEQPEGGSEQRIHNKRYAPAAHMEPALRNAVQMLRDTNCNDRRLCKRIRL